jgi:catechol 2,3-dioxygenase-like lactoylglutathione lyase family enzyme
MRLAAITYLCHDYDEAITWFIQVLGWKLVEDRVLSPDKRWVRVAPPGGGSELLLARASGSEKAEAVGRLAGGRVGLFLHVADLDAEYRRLTAAGVAFREPPRIEDYGTVAVFEDLYGNKWDLIEPRVRPLPDAGPAKP